MTAKGFIRADQSTYHAVEYDTVTGERVRGYTFQGFADESAWSRGQGWAIYGYVESARETGNLEYLRLAEKLADYFLERLGDRRIPPNDFDAIGEDAKILDSAAGAVVATALIEMGRIHPNAAAGKRWSARGCEMLAALCTDAFAAEDSHRGALKHSCYSRPHNEGVDSATMFGDFFFTEALCRVVHAGRFRPETSALA
jgi:unsaturated chondroitin disaccharide hydrolase